MKLSRDAHRRLAGESVVVEGQVLDVQTQLMLEGAKRLGIVQTEDVDQARRQMDEDRRVVEPNAPAMATERDVLIPGDCAFGCDVIGKDGLDYQKVQKVCPSANWVIVSLNGINQLGEPKVGTTKINVHLGHLTGGQDLTSDWTDGATLSDVTADHINGKVDMKSDAGELHGAFTAKVCP